MQRIEKLKHYLLCSLLVVGLSLLVHAYNVLFVDISAQQTGDSKTDPVNPTVIAAVIAAVTSIAAAVLTGLFGILNQKTLSKLQNESQRRIALLQEQIDIRKKKTDARTTYEFEARKRLYEECEPILFQLYERAENALHRIRDLAEKSNNGEFQHCGGAPAQDSYTIQSTIFRLLSPIAAHKLLQRKLTFVDLKVDKRIRIQYDLTRRLYFSFAADEKLSRIEPSIYYYPEKQVEEQKRTEYPKMYYNLQGIKAGIIDNLANTLIIDKEGQASRLRDFGEFQQVYSENEIFSHIRKLFLNFHPKTSPLLWRILIAQYHILDALLKTYNTDYTPGQAPKLLRMMSSEERTRFDWRQGQDKEKIPEEKVLEEPFRSVEAYLREYFGLYF